MTFENNNENAEKCEFSKQKLVSSSGNERKSKKKRFYRRRERGEMKREKRR